MAGKLKGSIQLSRAEGRDVEDAAWLARRNPDKLCTVTVKRQKLYLARQPVFRGEVAVKVEVQIGLNGRAATLERSSNGTWVLCYL